MTWLRSVAYGLVRALRGSARRPFVSLSAAGAIGVALLLVGVVGLAATHVAALTERWDRGVQMVVYLTDGTTPERARAIGRVLRTLPGVEMVDYVPADAALHRLEDSLGPRRDLLEGVEVGFLPASLEVRLAGGVRRVAGASGFIERLKQTAGVEEVELLGDWVERLAALSSALRIVLLAVGLLVGAACIYVVAGTIKLGMYARREELEVLRLVGATERFIELPLIVEGALQGALGAATAVGLLYTAHRFGAPLLARMLSGAVGDVELPFLAPSVCGLAICGGVVLGLLGSWLAIGRHADT